MSTWNFKRKEKFYSTSPELNSLRILFFSVKLQPFMTPGLVWRLDFFYQEYLYLHHVRERTMYLTSGGFGISRLSRRCNAFVLCSRLKITRRKPRSLSTRAEESLWCYKSSPSFTQTRRMPCEKHRVHCSSVATLWYNLPVHRDEGFHLYSSSDVTMVSDVSEIDCK